MGVKTYSLARDGGIKLSKDFCVREFACEGTDKVIVCEETVAALQKIRDHFGKAVEISSGFRLPESGTSQHNKGRATDFRIAGVNPRDIIRWIESNLSPPGLGLYDYDPVAIKKGGFVHIDYRTGAKATWVQTTTDDSTYRSLKGKSITTEHIDKQAGTTGATTTQPTLRRGDKGDIVRLLQTQIKAQGFDPGTIDGAFGVKTEAAVRAFQSKKGLVADGIVGAKTWAALA